MKSHGSCFGVTSGFRQTVQKTWHCDSYAFVSAAIATYWKAKFFVRSVIH
jgi:hypothetical protein